MSFSFKAAGAPQAVIAKVGAAAASAPQFPQAFADAINLQLDALPAHASVQLNTYGHTGWGEAQTAGEISMHVSMIVSAPRRPEREDAAEGVEPASAE